MQVFGIIREIKAFAALRNTEASIEWSQLKNTDDAIIAMAIA